MAGAHALLFVAAFSLPWAWPAAILMPAPLAWLALSRVPFRLAAGAVGACQVAAWLWLLRWIVGVTGPGYAMLSIYLASYGVLFVWVLRLAARSADWPAAILVPVVWVACEFLRGEVAFDGYPWYMAGQPAASWPAIVQSADLGGGYFSGFVLVTVAGLAVERRRGRRLAVTAAAVGAAQVLNLVYGAWRLGQEPGPPGPAVLAIQTNLPQDNKIGWPEERQAEDFASFLDLSVRGAEAAAAAGLPADLIAWPETMLPGVGLEADSIEFLAARGIDEPRLFAAGIESFARQSGAAVLVGAAPYLGLRHDGDEIAWDSHHNSAYLIAGDPPWQRYDKVFLTPFGETMPYISRWPWLERQLLSLGAAGMRFDLDAADEPRLVTMRTRDGRTLRLGTPICFEDTSGRVCRRMVYEGGRKRADLLVNLSNDGWFGADDASRRLHGQIARLRCIENRVPLARCANTGLSGFFDSCGRRVASLASSHGTANPPAREAGWAAAELRLDARSTLYGRVGDAWGWVCLLAAAAAAVAGARRGRRVEPV
jgi:apolipoprotein N-acyltransferase